MAIDSGGNAYVSGVAGSTNFPTTSGAFQTTNNSTTSPACDNGFVTKINPKGSELVYSTYIGGRGSFDSAHNILYCDMSNALSLDTAGNVYIAGTTGSSDFPITKGAYLTKNPEVAEGGFSTGFVSKLNPAGSELVYSTYLGGSDGSSDGINGLGIDSDDNVYVTGFTYSDSFPVSTGAYQTKNPGASNLAQASFVSELNPAGSGLLFSGYFGGSDGDFATAIAVDSDGAAYIAGQTGSTNFPTTAGAYQTKNNEATLTAFVAKLNVANPVSPASTPVFTPAAGTYSGAQKVAITDTTPGAVIYYTTTGVTPTTASTKYTGPITVAATETLEAIAVATGYSNSTVAEAKYTIEVPAATPVFAPPTGTYVGAQKVTVSSTIPRAALYCTTNGAAPTTTFTRYSAAITVAASETLECIATAPGYLNSAVGVAKYVIETAAATPIVSVKAGVYESVQSVTITDATPGAVIHYTTNGTAPTAASAKYTAPITVSASETITAIATATGFGNSAVVSEVYTIVGSPSALSAPATAITNTGATLNAVVDSLGLAGSYYFQYGTSSTALTSTTAKTAVSAGTAPIDAAAKLTTLAAKTTYYYQAVVTTAGGASSGAILSFTTEATAAATPDTKALPVFAPTFSPAAGTYATAQTLKLTSETTGVVICYSTNGVPPNSASCTRYTGPITVGKSETIDAIAVADGRVSATTSAKYTIE